MNSSPVVFFKINLPFHGTDSTLGMVDFWLWRVSSLQSLVLELDNMESNVNQLEKPVGPAWRVSSCVDVREHSRTGVTTAPLFALFQPSPLQSCPCFRVPAPVHRRPNDAHQPTPHHV